MVTVLVTRPRISSGAWRSAAANRPELPAGASSTTTATGSATSGDGITTAATANSSAPARSS